MRLYSIDTAIEILQALIDAECDFKLSLVYGHIKLRLIARKKYMSQVSCDEIKDILNTRKIQGIIQRSESVRDEMDLLCKIFGDDK